MAKASKLQQYKTFYHHLSLDFEGDTLPISYQIESRYDRKLLTYLFLLYVLSSLMMQLLWPQIFLGYLFHLICFLGITLLIYQLCPPIEMKTIYIDAEQVEIEILSATHCQLIQIPLNQYRGIVSLQIEKSHITHQQHEYGIALKHPDPKKTILMISPKQQQHLLKKYADMLGLHALDDSKFILELKD
jgi:hypothetical protein